MSNSKIPIYNKIDALVRKLAREKGKFGLFISGFKLFLTYSLMTAYAHTERIFKNERYRC